MYISIGCCEITKGFKKKKNGKMLDTLYVLRDFAQG